MVNDAAPKMESCCNRILLERASTEKKGVTKERRYMINHSPGDEGIEFRSKEEIDSLYGDIDDELVPWWQIPTISDPDVDDCYVDLPENRYGLLIAGPDVKLRYYTFSTLTKELLAAIIQLACIHTGNSGVIELYDFRSNETLLNLSMNRTITDPSQAPSELASKWLGDSLSLLPSSTNRHLRRHPSELSLLIWKKVERAVRASAVHYAKHYDRHFDEDGPEPTYY
jgi:hypothetical protein